MHFKRTLAIAIVGVCLLGTAARAQDDDYKPWEFYSGVGKRGTPFCSLSTATDGNGIAQILMIKGFKGKEPKLVVDLYRDTWNKPRGSTREVMFDFANNNPMTVQAYADAHLLDIEIPTNSIGWFLLGRMDSPAMQVIFPDGNDPTWIVTGDGYEKALRKFMNCWTIHGRP